MMVYDVKYRLDGEERIDRVIAPHAAGAAEHVSNCFAELQTRFELLLVTMLHRADRPADAGR